MSLPFCLGVASRIWVAVVRRAAFCTHTRPNRYLLARRAKRNSSVSVPSSAWHCLTWMECKLCCTYLRNHRLLSRYNRPNKQIFFGQSFLTLSVHVWPKLWCPPRMANFYFVVAHRICWCIRPIVWSSKISCYNVTISNICRMLVCGFAKFSQTQSLRHTKVSFFSNFCDFCILSMLHYLQFRQRPPNGRPLDM